MDLDDMPEGLLIDRDGIVEGRPADGLDGFVVGLSGFTIGCSGFGLSGLFGGLCPYPGR
jgi:hypothetical protein